MRYREVSMHRALMQIVLQMYPFASRYLAVSASIMAATHACRTLAARKKAERQAGALNCDETLTLTGMSLPGPLGTFSTVGSQRSIGKPSACAPSYALGKP